jgi:hypothetical protein
MSNLSELLPTGGGQNAVDFVASGTLSSGQAVALKTDGTVDAVVTLGPSVGSSNYLSGKATEIQTIYASDIDKVITVYRNNSGYGVVQVGTPVSGGVSWGTAVVFQSNSVGWPSVSWSPVSQRWAVFYLNYSDYFKVTTKLGTISGTTPSVTHTNTHGSFAPLWASAVYHPTYDRAVFTYSGEYTEGFYYPRYYLFELTTTGVVSRSSGNTYGVFGAYIRTAKSAYDVQADRVVLVGTNSNVNGGAVFLGQVTSGTSMTWTGPTAFPSGRSDGSAGYAVAYESTNQKTVIAFENSSNSDRGQSYVVSISGSTPSFGTISTFTTNAVDYVSAAFDPIAGTVGVGYKDITTSNYGYAAAGTVSGTSISFSTPIVVRATNTTDWFSAVYTPTFPQVIFQYLVTTGSENQYYSSFVGSSTNLPDFIGITAEAISDTATGAVNVYGGINEAQTGLTIGSDYYVQADGSLSTTVSSVKVGQAISATTINMMDLT